MCAKGLFYDLDCLGEERVRLLLADGHWKKKERRMIEEWLRLQGVRQARKARRWKTVQWAMGFLVAAATAWFGYQQAHKPETTIVQSNGEVQTPTK